tara:strand:+ start:76134 stop:76685 length:552 start_codon:yes stop_codon:yes gene_type:complete
MAIKQLLIAPEKKLKELSKPVKFVDSGVSDLINDMFETMYAAEGIGLAAIQIGIPKRVIIVDIHEENEPSNPMCLINPVIIEASDKKIVYNEGCLSLPEHFAEIERPGEVKISYIDRNNENHEISAQGVLAVCLQHEIDHLDGILFVDYLSALKRKMILRKLAKAKRVEGEKFGQPVKKKNRL